MWLPISAMKASFVRWHEWKRKKLLDANFDLIIALGFGSAALPQRRKAWPTTRPER